MALTAAETGLARLRDAPHELRGKGGRPDHRRLPGERAGADPHRARRGPARGRRAAAPQASGSGRIPAFEVLLGSSALSNAIREGKTAQINNQIQTGRSRGMVSMDQSLAELVRLGLVDPECRDGARLRSRSLHALCCRPFRGRPARRRRGRRARRRARLREAQGKQRAPPLPAGRPPPSRRAAPRSGPRSRVRSRSPGLRGEERQKNLLALGGLDPGAAVGDRERDLPVAPRAPEDGARAPCGARRASLRRRCAAGWRARGAEAPRSPHRRKRAERATATPGNAGLGLGRRRFGDGLELDGLGREAFGPGEEEKVARHAAHLLGLPPDRPHVLGRSRGMRASARSA